MGAEVDEGLKMKATDKMQLALAMRQKQKLESAYFRHLKSIDDLEKQPKDKQLELFKSVARKMRLDGIELRRGAHAESDVTGHMAI